MGVAPRIPGGMASASNEKSTELTNIIPAMSSNSQNGYKVSIKSLSGNDESAGAAWYMFNHNYRVYNWTENGYSENVCHFGSGKDGQIDIELPEPTSVHAVFVIGPNYNSYGINGPKSAELYFSNDGANFTKVDDAVNIRKNSYAQLPMLGEQINMCLNPSKHKYYRIVVYRADEYVCVNAVILF